MGRALDLVGQRFGRLLGSGPAFRELNSRKFFYRKSHLYIDYLSKMIYNKHVIKKEPQTEQAVGR